LLFYNYHLPSILLANILLQYDVFRSFCFSYLITIDFQSVTIFLLRLMSFLKVRILESSFIIKLSDFLVFFMP
jgi:hypothetical protein